MLKLVLLLIIFNSQANSMTCNSLLAPKQQDHTSDIGFINIHNIPDELITAQQEAPSNLIIEDGLGQALPKYLRPQLYNIDQWKSNFLKQDPESIRLINGIIRAGKFLVKRENRPEDLSIILKSLNGFSRADFSNLTPSQKISLLKFFTVWKLIPHKSFLRKLELSISSDFEKWNNQDFLEFSFTRKLSPIIYSNKFIQKYKNVFMAKFDSFPSKIQILIMTGELYHKTFFKTSELSLLLDKINAAITSLSSEDVAFFGTLKDFFRGLLYLKVSQTSFFTTSIQTLTFNIELRLNQNGRSLVDGASTLKKEDPTIAPERKEIESRINLVFRKPKKIYEHVEPLKPGFFDPVDTFYPDLDFVFEWDGNSHYHKIVNEDGSINTDPYTFILRPMDQIKDDALEIQGYKVLRIFAGRDLHAEGFDFYEFLTQ